MTSQYLSIGRILIFTRIFLKMGILQGFDPAEKTVNTIHYMVYDNPSKHHMKGRVEIAGEEILRAW
jgi:hypothetical protein